MSTSEFFSPRLKGIESPESDFENAYFRRSKHLRVRDIVAKLQELGYEASKKRRLRLSIDKKVRDHFDISNEELRLCKLIAALYYKDSVFYRQNQGDRSDKTPISILVDENLSYKMVIDLMRNGLHVTHVHFENLDGLSDSKVWERGAQIIITKDHDFANIAKGLYLRRCQLEETQHVDTADLPLVIIVETDDKDALLNSFRQNLREIIKEAIAQPRLSLFGVFLPSGVLRLFSHQVVFNEHFLLPKDLPHEQFLKSHHARTFDEVERLLSKQSAKKIRRWRAKAKFPKGAFNEAARAPKTRLSPKAIQMARSHLTGTRDVMPVARVRNVAPRPAP